MVSTNAHEFLADIQYTRKQLVLHLVGKSDRFFGVYKELRLYLLIYPFEDQTRTHASPVLNPFIFFFFGKKFQAKVIHILIIPFCDLCGWKIPLKWREKLSFDSNLLSRRNRLMRTDTLNSSFELSTITSGSSKRKQYSGLCQFL